MITLFMRRFIKVADPNYYGLHVPFVLGWSGMRGVVSLAAALSIPTLTDAGMPFPERSMIIYITFVVILVTLLLQGLTLPILIERMKLPASMITSPSKRLSLSYAKASPMSACAISGRMRCVRSSATASTCSQWSPTG